MVPLKQTLLGGLLGVAQKSCGADKIAGQHFSIDAVLTGTGSVAGAWAGVRQSTA
jgi:hypothetical protein